MKIAFSADEDKGLDSTVNPHFGRCPFFVLVDMDGEEVIKVETLANPFSTDHRPGMVPQYIFEHKATVMVSGGIGRRAIDFFTMLNIQVVTGAEGLVKDALAKYLSGELNANQPCKESEEHHQHDHQHDHHHDH